METGRGFGRAKQQPLPSLIEFETLLVIRIMILREEESSDREPLELRYMEARIGGAGGSSRRTENVGGGDRSETEMRYWWNEGRCHRTSQAYGIGGGRRSS